MHEYTRSGYATEQRTGRRKGDRRPRSSRHSLTETDAAPYTGYSQAFLRQSRQRGRGPAYIKVGRSVRYRIEDLDAWLNAHRVETRDSRRLQAVSSGWRNDAIFNQRDGSSGERA
jgi:predicted DNA-binding transcriptional regulator AlpA